MRAVVQRVLRASVRCAPEPASSAESSSESGDGSANSIGDGLLVLLGIHRDDQDADLDWMVHKLLNLKVFNDSSHARWKLSVKELGLEILCISQFTLYGNTTKGNKPDFHHSMLGPQSEPLYRKFLLRLSEMYDPVKIQKGFFGQRMLIDSQMDGPVTVVLDSPMKGEKAPKTPVTNGKRNAGDAKAETSVPPAPSDAKQMNCDL